MSVRHKYQTEGEGIHQIFNWVWADETARLAETDINALDIKKYGLQESDNSIWMLTAVTPTWEQMGGRLVRNGAGTYALIISADPADIHDADGDYSTVLSGTDNHADGNYSFIPVGNECNAQTDYSTAEGFGAITWIYGQKSRSANYFVSGGDAQYSDIHLTALVTHSSAAWFPLFPNGVNDFAFIPTDTVYTFDALITGATQGLGKVFSFRIVGCIKNTAGVTTLSGTPTVTTISDGDDVSFDARAVANNTEGSLDIEVQDSDGAGNVVRWTAVVRLSELKFPA